MVRQVQQDLREEQAAMVLQVPPAPMPGSVLFMTTRLPLQQTREQASSV